MGTLTPAAPGPNCVPSRGIATIRDGRLTFVPAEGVWVLSGTASPDGSLSARRDTPGTNHQPYVTRLTGTWTPASITGTYATPGCTFAVQLDRPG